MGGREENCRKMLFFFERESLKRSISLGQSDLEVVKRTKGSELNLPSFLRKNDLNSVKRGINTKTF